MDATHQKTKQNYFSSVLLSCALHFFVNVYVLFLLLSTIMSRKFLSLRVVKTKFLFVAFYAMFFWCCWLKRKSSFITHLFERIFFEIIHKFRKGYRRKERTRETQQLYCTQLEKRLINKLGGSKNWTVTVTEFVNGPFWVFKNLICFSLWSKVFVDFRFEVFFSFGLILCFSENQNVVHVYCWSLFVFVFFFSFAKIGCMIRTFGRYSLIRQNCRVQQPLLKPIPPSMKPILPPWLWVREEEEKTTTTTTRCLTHIIR